MKFNIKKNALLERAFQSKIGITIYTYIPLSMFPYVSTCLAVLGAGLFYLFIFPLALWDIFVI